MIDLPKAESITHQHILSTINTLILHDEPKEIIRILDAGCGNGKLIAYLHTCLHSLHKNIRFYISGYDVCDHGVQPHGFMIETIKSLNAQIPEVDWQTRIHSVQLNECWSFSSEKYDYIISNQVLEHVRNKDFFFSNIYRNLTNGGYSLHLAPLKHVVHEGHIYLPWAHRIRSYSALNGYIRLMSRIGFGKYRQHNKKSNCTLDEFSMRHADYMFFWTCYSSESETLEIARRNGLRCDFRFTMEFYLSKIRQVVNAQPIYSYSFRESGFVDSIAVKFLRYISSTTLVCKKKNIY